jgi:hypothetical protein
MARKRPSTKLKIHASPEKIRRTWKRNPLTRVKPEGRRVALDKVRQREEKSGEV